MTRPSPATEVEPQATVKVVGSRRSTRSGLEATDDLLRTVLALRRGRPFIPRGVHRFRSFEEAEEWSLRMTTRPSSRDHRD